MATVTSVYSRSWFRSFRDSAGQSAAVIVPHLLEITGAERVVDVGCGVGAWLAEYQRHGVTELMGVDGAYVDTGDLLFDADRFVAHDLRRPLEIEAQFDLCQCLEVAEHLPAAGADHLVASLTRLAPVVYFSAAIPGQGGTQHVNEQWPGYWVSRFARHGYQLVDAIRPRIWADPRVDFWYAQNGVLFASEAALRHNGCLRAAYERTQTAPLALVHPRLLERTVMALENTWDQRCRRWLRRTWRTARSWQRVEKPRCA